MLFMILEANTIEEELCTLIRNKDQQIEDYKSSSAQLTRRKEFNLLHFITNILTPLFRAFRDSHF